jgi:hypothetical protein
LAYLPGFSPGKQGKTAAERSFLLKVHAFIAICTGKIVNPFYKRVHL